MLRTLFIIAVLVPALYAAMRSRYAALLVYLWFALFRPQEWVWFDLAQFRLSLVLGVLLLVPALLSGRFPNLSHPLSLGMVLFLCSELLSQLTAVHPEVGWQWIDFSARLFIAVMLLVTLASEPARLLGVIAVIGGSLALHAAKAGFVYAAVGGVRFEDGLAGAFVDSNGYALATVMILPLLVVAGQNVELVYSGPWARCIRAAWFVAVPFSVLAIVGTYSRGGFLALAVSTLVFAALQRRRLKALSGISIGVLVVLLLAPIPDSYFARLETIRTYEEVGENSALSRQHFWRVGIQMGLENPLGIGLRQYEAAYNDYDTSGGRYGYRRSVHSAHVQVFAELGIVGAVLWVALFTYASVLCLRIRRRSRDERLAPAMQRFLFTAANGLLTSMAGFVVGGSFIALALNDLTWLTFGMIAALDRISRTPEIMPAPVAAPATPAVWTPVVFRAVDRYAPPSPHVALRKEYR